MSEPAKLILKLFYCYAHEDKALRDTLDRHLSILKRQKLIDVWYDREISPGMEWEKEIDQHLSSADIVLLLVSADFLASDYCYGKEMAQALQRHEEGTARVVPIILRPVHWKDAPFSKLLVLPTEAKPVTSWIDPHEAYTDIARRLDEVAKELQDSPKTAEGWFQRGEALRNSGRYTDAIPAYNQAIRLDPSYKEAYNGKGFVLHELRRYEEALQVYDHVLQFNSDNLVALISRGFLLSILEQHEEAVVVYDQVIRLNPSFAGAYDQKGIALYELQRYDEALVAFDEANRLDPNYIEAYHNKGNVLSSLERYEEAIGAYDQAIRLDPNFVLSYYSKGNALYFLNRHEDAIVVYDQAIDLNPNYANAYYNKGITLSELKRHKEANIAFEKAIQFNPRFAEGLTKIRELARQGVGLLMASQGNFSETGREKGLPISRVIAKKSTA